MRKKPQPRLLYPRVLCLGVGEEQLPAGVVPMGMKERHPLWVQNLGSGFGLPRKLLGPDLLILSGSSVGTQGVHSSYKVLTGRAAGDCRMTLHPPKW